LRLQLVFRRRLFARHICGLLNFGEIE
jgi:hypothetical protein